MSSYKLSEIQINSQIIRAKDIQINFDKTPVKYYRHGWQSWSLAAWTDLSHFPVQKPKIYHPLQADPIHINDKNPNGSWLGAAEFKDGNILLLGALGLDAHVTLNNHQLSGDGEAGEIEWFIAYGRENAIFSEYAEELGRHFGKVKRNGAPRVWCSWYSLYHMIDEEILFDTFDKLGDLPFDILQVDDGWQKDIGDWEANDKFPSGMNALAGKIKSTGRKAGLWLAPLIATETSKLFHKHSDWFLRDENGGFVPAGFNWGEHLFVLDTTLPDVISWLAALMKQVRAWGFDYLKLDFLYGGALKGKRYKDMPREAAYRECLLLLRETMGADAFFLTCGTPILPAIGTCDAIRIGPDVAHKWEVFRDAVLLYNPTTPGTKNAIRTVAHRLWLKPLAHLDPDVAYFAERENGLTHEQKTQLQDLAFVAEFKATSDLPQWMTDNELEQVRKYLLDAPKIKQADERYKYYVDDRVVDFTSAASLPTPPTGLTQLWAAFVGWLGNLPFVLRIFKLADDNALKKRRSSL